MDHATTRQSLGAPPGTQYVSRKALFGEQIEEIDDEGRQKLSRLVHANIEDDAKRDKVVDESLMKSRPDPSDDDEQVFRLFSTPTPQKIALKPTSIKEYNDRVSDLRKLRKQQLISLRNDRESIRLSVITAEQVLAESKIPWERCFVPHKVIHVPYKDDKEETKKWKKRRKSKKRRDAEKRGIIKKQTRFYPRLSKAGQSYTYGYRSRKRTIDVDKVNSIRLDVYKSGTQGTSGRIIRTNINSNDEDSFRHNWVSSRGRERELHRQRGRTKWNSRGRF